MTDDHENPKTHMQTMSRTEERRGTRWQFVSAAVVALAVACGLVVWFFVPGFSEPHTPKNAGIRSDQAAGVSLQSQATEPLRTTTPNSTVGYATQRNEKLTASEAPNLKPLGRQQVEAIQKYAAAHADAAVQNADFTITVGAAVPKSVTLKDMPPELGKALPSYANDAFIIVDNQFIVVEGQTRRIVAIVPTPATKESTR